MNEFYKEFLKDMAVAFILFILIVAVICLTGCNRSVAPINHPVEELRIDSIIEAYDSKLDSINKINEELVCVIDSVEKCNNQLTIELDSVREELLVSNYKLERIREYNRIAAQGNNITFLRGWINRVLNE